MSNRDSKGRFTKRRVMLGDKVYHTSSGKSDPGVIIAIDRAKARVRWEKDFEQWNLIENLRIMEPAQPCANHSAPQPKAEEGKPDDYFWYPKHQVACQENAKLRREASAKDAEIASLQSEIGSLKAEVRSAQDGRGEAEAKLADIRAINRASDLLGWDAYSLRSGIQTVLDRP